MNPSDVHYVERLKNLIADQIPIIEIALMVHKAKAPSAMLPLHERLEECFKRMQTHVELTYGKRTTDLRFEKDPLVVLRKGALPTNHAVDNRLSETSMGSSE
jgi:dedicator of cytokinesis protein 1